MKGRDHSPSGSGSCSMGVCVLFFSQSRLGAVLDVAAFALVLLAWKRGTTNFLARLCP